MKRFLCRPVATMLLGATGCLVAGGSLAAEPRGVPAGYRLLYEQHFDRTTALQDFVLTDPRAWKIANDDQGTALELTRQSQYQPPVRSPVNIALLADRVFGDFVLEADLLQTGREYGHRDMCVFFGVQNPSQFYYVHLATAADDHAHNIFLVNRQPRTKIAKQTTAGVNWGLGVWHKVRLERELASGAIRVFFDDLTQPIMVAEDKTFGAGFIGFGSFDDTGKIDNVSIWAPAVELRKTEFFGRPVAKAPERERGFFCRCIRGLVRSGGVIASARRGSQASP
jgi:hypothetical protein